MKPRVLCIAGPTASGKSALAMEVAQELHGEIVCMDSMQIYRGMDIGTAKPTKAEREKVPHHLVDIADPQETYTVARYVEDAKEAIANIHAREKTPLLVGGTGFYLQALTHGLNLGGVRSDPKVRERLKSIAHDEAGKIRLHQMLEAVDPETAKRLHANDVVRVSRALEVYELSGIPMSKQEQAPYDSPFAFCVIGTTMERKLLYDRINRRVDVMMRDGLPAEVQSLLDRGVSPQAQAMQGIGYKELVPVLLEKRPAADAVEEIQRNSRRYAKRQLTWFRRDESVHWLDMTEKESVQTAMQIMREYLKG